jgi:hypothetical protein
MTNPTDPLDVLAPPALVLAGKDAAELATIWATVDLERALHDLGEIGEAAAPASASAEAMPDAHLGARVVYVPARDGRPALALAEPTTEGRLAATLARHGEGPAGRYLSVSDGLPEVRARAAATGIAMSRVEPGPFGRSILVLIGPVTGPHLILCEPAAVPSGS